MDWSLRACARHGHATYRPTESDLAEDLQTQTPAGLAWKCLRCGAFIPGEPFEHGPAAHAPAIAHDRQIRDLLIIRFLAVERGARGLLVLIIAGVVWQLRTSKSTLEELLERTIPALKPFADEIGWKMDDSHILHLLHTAVTTSLGTLTLVAFLLFAYGILQCVEATGLWNQKRWAEYLTVVATSAFIPLEIYELTAKVTVVKIGALVINILAVVWLVWTKHLFGFNGGAAAAHDDIPSGLDAINFAREMTTTVPSA